MSPPTSSIQSFYPRKKPSTPGVGDGFTQDEVHKSLHPLMASWVPKRDYKKLTIAQVFTGTVDAELTGRVIHILPTFEKDWVSMVIKDDTSALGIQLFSQTIPPFLRYGALATVYVTLVSSNPWSNIPRIPLVGKHVRITPSSSPSSPTFIKFHQQPTPHQQTLCRLPLLYSPRATNPIDGLMSLKTYLDSGHDGISGVRILVCINSIGLRKSVTVRKTGEEIDLVKVGIFDDTAAAVLNLWSTVQVQSAEDWIPNETILLLGCPELSESGQRMKKEPKEIKISRETTVDVDPQCDDANWLRRRAQNLVRREKVFIPFPAGVWDREAAIHGEIRTLFTLSELDEFARDESEQGNFTGKFCGVPLFSNKTTERCRNCSKEREMALSPRVVGNLADETGCIEQGKLVWSDQALNQLFMRAGPRQTFSFGSGDANSRGAGGNNGSNGEGTIIGDRDKNAGGRDPGIEKDDDDLFDEDSESWEWLTLLSSMELREIEEDILDSRITLTFGWAKEIERLCILGVEW
ncbi:nucleic acid-binding protein [Zalerion maritima]|uniref:Nucleic acid-binding protein n=1 Tax=Zalerion maritima TaxID=339359 RepID=A0AAD5RQT0_9PEZI|nr:nucleic acid-binding protein [Zalerion maritima]